jgi:hypothetical protein
MEQIQNCFITSNLKIKGNTLYLILFIEAHIYPIESMIMTEYLMYKNNRNNMEGNMISKIASNSSQSHVRLKRGWHKDVKSWLNHWGLKEEVTLQNNNNIISKFRENLWCDKIKLRYYMEVINPNLEDQKSLCFD